MAAYAITLHNIGKITGTPKVRTMPTISATSPNSLPTTFVTGTNMESMFPAAPDAMGALLLTRPKIGRRSTVTKSLNTLIINP